MNIRTAAVIAEGEIADLAIRRMGQRVRTLRSERQLTLRALAELTGLSPQMLSQVERGNTSPSVGTLVVIAAALEVNIGDLFGEPHVGQDAPLRRRQEQDVVDLDNGVTIRVVVRDLRRHIEIAEAIYASGAASASKPRHHSGYEFVTVIEGKLKVEVGHATYLMRAGDSLRFASKVNHRYLNVSTHPARVVVVNLLT